MARTNRPSRPVVAVIRLALLLPALGCSDAKSHEPAQEAVMDGSTVRDAGRDTAPRVKERLVAIELPPVARRTFRAGPDGEFVYGEIEPLAGAESCIVERRAAFASLAPFEPLDPPKCVTTEADEVVRFEEVPANSDLLITVTREGFVPATLTFRVETLDIPVPGYFGTVRTVLLEPGQADPWLEAPSPASETGQAVLYATMVGSAPGANQGLGYGGIVPTWATTAGAHMTLELEDGAEATPIELDTPSGRPVFLELPAGSYRVHVTHPRARCEPTAMASYTPWGLGADGPSDLELPVLTGHSAWLVAACWCFPSRPEDTPIDLPTCTHAPP